MTLFVDFVEEIIKNFYVRVEVIGFIVCIRLLSRNHRPVFEQLIPSKTYTFVDYVMLDRLIVEKK